MTIPAAPPRVPLRVTTSFVALPAVELALLLCVLCLLRPGIAAAQGSGQTQVVEEVLAVVGHTPILRSDLDLAELLRLAVPDPDETRQAYRSRLLDLRIRLELQLRDLESSGILFRLEPETGVVLQELERAAGGEEELHSRLQDLGVQWNDVEELALRIAAARCYVEQRLRPQIAVRQEELQQAYQTLVREELQPRNAPVPPFDQLREQLQQLLVEQKLNAEIAAWTEHARERLGVTRFVP